MIWLIFGLAVIGAVALLMVQCGVRPMRILIFFPLAPVFAALAAYAGMLACPTEPGVMGLFALAGVAAAWFVSGLGASRT